MKINVFVLGASGFVGRHLVDRMIENLNLNITVLTRKPLTQMVNIQRLTAINCDLLQRDTLRGVFKTCDVLINLIYNRDASGSENIQMMQNLLHACQNTNIKKIIHLSTALVVGSNHGECLDEDIERCADSGYKSSKLAIERMFLCSLAASEVVVLRPTVVFGVGGINLNEYINQLLNENPIRGSLRASFVGKAPMNLIPVQTVVEAIVFFLELNKKCDGVYFVSQDDDAKNNLSSIDDLISREMHIARPLRLKLVPTLVRKSILRLLGIYIYNNATYSNKKIKSLGFDGFYDFEEAICILCKDFAGRMKNV